MASTPAEDGGDKRMTQQELRVLVERMMKGDAATQVTDWGWPSREEWARDRRTVYADMENPHPATRQLSAYATADEIAAAIAAVKAIHREVCRAERVGKPSRADRNEVNDVLRRLRSDLVPWRWVAMGCSTPPAPLDAIMARYQAAKKQADARWQTEVEATPIDDAAWKEELQRRRRIED
jgi:hypothetical protein